MHLYSVYDSKAEAYNKPFHARNDATALRMFGSAACDTDTELFRFGGDYTLFRIGDWDEETGRIYMQDAFFNLGTAMMASQQIRQALTVVDDQEETG